MVDMTLKRPLNKFQGQSFWYQSISHNTTSDIGYQYINCCSRAHRLATKHTLQTYRQTTDRRNTVA